MGSILLWVMLISSGGMPDSTDLCNIPTLAFVDEDCDKVSLWLQPGCGRNFRVDRYQECLSQASWLHGGVCNLLAAQCRNQDSYGNLIPMSVSGLSFGISWTFFA